MLAGLEHTAPGGLGAFCALEVAAMGLLGAACTIAIAAPDLLGAVFSFEIAQCFNERRFLLRCIPGATPPLAQCADCLDVEWQSASPAEKCPLICAANPLKSIDFHKNIWEYISHASKYGPMGLNRHLFLVFWCTGGV